MRPRHVAGLAASLLSACLCGCVKQAQVPDKPRTSVRVVTVKSVEFAPEAMLTGDIQATVRNDLAFRVGGRIASREADVGDHVTTDQVLARIDPQEQRANVVAAEATVSAAEAQARQAAATFERQRALLARGFTTRRDHDQAEQANSVAQEAVNSAQAQLASIKDQLNQTRLVAGVDGVIVTRHAEVGQTVMAAQPVFTIAVDGGRDAVFNVPEAAFLAPPSVTVPVDVRLAADPSIHAPGRIREVSPTIDTATGTVKVKVAVDSPPAGMGLGAVVVGSLASRRGEGVLLPWNALASDRGVPAVWIVDPKETTVSLRPVTIGVHLTGAFLVTGALRDGELVVADGAQLLHPNDKVEVRR